MSGVVEAEVVEETSTLSPEATRTTSPTMNHHDPQNDETWSTTLTLTSMTDSSLEEKAMGDIDTADTTKNPYISHNGEVGYTTNTPASLLNLSGCTLGQYSPGNFQKVIETSKKDAPYNTDTSMSTAVCSNGLPKGGYTPGDQKDVEVIYMADKGKLDASPIEKLNISEDHYTNDSGVATSLPPQPLGLPQAAPKEAL